MIRGMKADQPSTGYVRICSPSEKDVIGPDFYAEGLYGGPLNHITNCLTGSMPCVSIGYPATGQWEAEFVGVPVGTHNLYVDTVEGQWDERLIVVSSAGPSRGKWTCLKAYSISGEQTARGAGVKNAENRASISAYTFLLKRRPAPPLEVWRLAFVNAAYSFHIFGEVPEGAQSVTCEVEDTHGEVTYTKKRKWSAKFGQVPLGSRIVEAVAKNAKGQVVEKDQIRIFFGL